MQDGRFFLSLARSRVGTAVFPIAKVRKIIRIIATTTTFLLKSHKI